MEYLAEYIAISPATSVQLTFVFVRLTSSFAPSPVLSSGGWMSVIKV